MSVTHRKNAKGIIVGTYQLVAMTGRPIHKATKVTFPDGYEVKLLERMPAYMAIVEAMRERARRLKEDAK